MKHMVREIPPQMKNINLVLANKALPKTNKCKGLRSRKNRNDHDQHLSVSICSSIRREDSLADKPTVRYKKKIVVVHNVEKG